MDTITMAEIKQQIASAYPEQDEQWMTEQWGRVIDKIDVIVPELNDAASTDMKLAHDLLEENFGIYYCNNCTAYIYIIDELEACLFCGYCGELIWLATPCDREACRHNEL